jgi:putative oxidoreductase
MGSRFLAALRLTAAAVLVAFGAAKLGNHGAEAASFDRYGLPDPNLFVYAVGVLELGLGMLLLLGLRTRIAAIVLAGNMIGAIATAGRLEGGVVNLGLAPTLLLVLLVLAARGAGRWSLDARVRG